MRHHNDFAIDASKLKTASHCKNFFYQNCSQHRLPLFPLLGPKSVATAVLIRLCVVTTAVEMVSIKGRHQRPDPKLPRSQSTNLWTPMSAH